MDREVGSLRGLRAVPPRRPVPGTRRGQTCYPRAMLHPAIGTITPSSNRTVETTLAAILRHLPGVESCVARIPYYGNAEGQPPDRYDLASFREAAWLLGHAGIGAVCWNGSRGATLGLAADEALCEALAQAAGCPATTTTLAAAALLQARGLRRVAIVTQGDPGYATQSAAGLGVAPAGIHAFGVTDNRVAAAIGPADLAHAARAAFGAAPADAVLIWGTNLAGWSVMAPLEAGLGVPVIDSAALGVQAALVLAGVDCGAAGALGSLFRA